MTTKTDEITRRLKVEIADDSLQVWIRLVDPGDLHSLTFEEIVPALEEAKIAVNDAVRSRIEKLINLMGGEGERPKRFLIAEGRHAVEGKDGEFLWHESFSTFVQDWQGDGPIDYYDFNSLQTVEKDQPIGTLVPAVAGTNGVDVFGKTLTAPGHPKKDVELDSSVKLSDDSTTVLANCAGKVVCQEGKLSICEEFEVKRDVDFETGNIDSSVDVHVAGTIRDLFAVKSEKTIAVSGAIEAATVEAKGDVIVRGGIIQRHKGSVSSGRDIVAKFCDGARLHATGCVMVAKELMNSQVYSMEKLLVAQGAVIGGKVYAREGVEVATLGSDACVPTEITVGTDPNVVREVDHLRKSLKPKRLMVERIRQSVQPLMANLKRLSASQKERATELLFKADAAETEIAEAQSEHTRMLERAGAMGIPYVLVSMVIHRGATIRIGRRKITFSKEVRGPVRIEKRKIKTAMEFVAIDQLSGSVTVLPSTYVVEQTPAETREPTEKPSDTGHGSGG